MVILGHIIQILELQLILTLGQVQMVKYVQQHGRWMEMLGLIHIPQQVQVQILLSRTVVHHGNRN